MENPDISDPRVWESVLARLAEFRKKTEEIEIELAAIMRTPDDIRPISDLEPWTEVRWIAGAPRPNTISTWTSGHARLTRFVGPDRRSVVDANGKLIHDIVPPDYKLRVIAPPKPTLDRLPQPVRECVGKACSLIGWGKSADEAIDDIARVIHEHRTEIAATECPISRTYVGKTDVWAERQTGADGEIYIFHRDGIPLDDVEKFACDLLRLVIQGRQALAPKGGAQ